MQEVCSLYSPVVTEIVIYNKYCTGHYWNYSFGLKLNDVKIVFTTAKSSLLRPK